MCVKPFVPTEVEALNLHGLRVVLIDKKGKVIFRIPHANMKLAMDMAESNSWEFSALVARDGKELAQFNNGERVSDESKVLKRLVEVKK